MNKLIIRDINKAIDILGEKDFCILNELLNKMNNRILDSEESYKLFRFAVILAYEEVYICEELNNDWGNLWTIQSHF